MKKIVEIIFLKYNLYEITDFRNHNWSNLFFNIKEYGSNILIGTYKGLLRQDILYWISIQKTEDETTINHCIGVKLKPKEETNLLLRTVITTYQDEATNFIASFIRKYKLPDKHLYIARNIEDNYLQIPPIFVGKIKSEKISDIVNKINILIKKKVMSVN